MQDNTNRHGGTTATICQTKDASRNFTLEPFKELGLTHFLGLEFMPISFSMHLTLLRCIWIWKIFQPLSWKGWVTAQQSLPYAHPDGLSPSNIMPQWKKVHKVDNCNPENFIIQPMMVRKLYRYPDKRVSGRRRAASRQDSSGSPACPTASEKHTFF